jgi:glucose-6-phosphate isomerase
LEEQLLQPRPFSFDISSPSAWEDHFDRHLERRISALRNQFRDQQASIALAADGDPLVYEVFEILRPEESGELMSGLSIVHPGKVGSEYFMTKGHYHSVRQTAEIYHCLRGQGLMVMENEQGDCDVQEFRPGRVVYVAPGWAHRSVNVSSSEPLMTFFVYPGHAGHDYAPIERTGFRKLVVQKGGQPAIVDNSAWSPITTVRQA